MARKIYEKKMVEGEVDGKKVMLEGLIYNINDSNVTKDTITGEYMLRNSRTHELRQYYFGISKLNILKSAFNIADTNTWQRYVMDVGLTRAHNLQKFIDNPENQLEFHPAALGPVVIYNTKEEIARIIKELELIPGINNPNAYFNQEELQVMDKPKPYRKFNFTYYKKTLQDVIDRKLTSAELNSEEIQGIKKNILKRNIDMGVESLTYKELEGLKYTFGVELETCLGRFENDDEVKHLNVKAVHDGSLREEGGGDPLGGEYVTGVLTGDAGLSQLHEICRVLQTKCTVDKRCGRVYATLLSN